MVVDQSAEFRDIAGFPGYRVGNDGSVWSCRSLHGRLTESWHPIKPQPDKDGYLQVFLRQNGKTVVCKVAHLVLTAFVGERPDGTVACHAPDPDPRNNKVSNLRWGTPQSNSDDVLAMGNRARGVTHGMHRLNEEEVLRMRGMYDRGEANCEHLALLFGISKSHAWNIVSRRSWGHV